MDKEIGYSSFLPLIVGFLRCEQRRAYHFPDPIDALDRENKLTDRRSCESLCPQPFHGGRGSACFPDHIMAFGMVNNNWSDCGKLILKFGEGVLVAFDMVGRIAAVETG